MPDASEEQIDRAPEDSVLLERLDAFLASFLGAWPPTAPLMVTSSVLREAPGWDGVIRPVAGVATPNGSLVSVPPAALHGARRLSEQGGAAFDAGVGELVGRPGASIRRGIFRSCRRLVEMPAIGEWLPSDDERLPEWLQVFPGEVLVSFDERGLYAAGVGLKRHNALGQEIAVGTEPQHRGRGLARELVAQAARRIYDDGSIATYLHAPDNAASAAVAEAAGFPDLGWQVLNLSGGD